MSDLPEPQPKPSAWLVIACFTFGVIPALLLDAMAVLMVVFGGKSGSVLPIVWGALAMLGTVGLCIAPWRPERWPTALLLGAGFIAMAAPLVAFATSFVEALTTSLAGAFLILGPTVVGAVHLGRFVKPRQGPPNLHPPGP